LSNKGLNLTDATPFPDTAAQPKKLSHLLLCKLWASLRSSLHMTQSSFILSSLRTTYKKGLFVPLSLTWGLHSCTSDS